MAQLTKRDRTRQSEYTSEGRLTIEQEAALTALLEGKTDGEAANVAGVSRQTVNGWVNHNAVFAAEMNARRSAIWGAQVERLRGLVSQAVGVLADDLDYPDPKLRQTAAVHVLRAVGLYGANLRPSGETTPEDVEAEWRQYQAMKALSQMF